MNTEDKENEINYLNHLIEQKEDRNSEQRKIIDNYTKIIEELKEELYISNIKKQALTETIISLSIKR